MAGNASEIRRGIYLKVRDEFNFNNVVGLSSLPPITQRATHRLEDPFIYIWSESQLEVNKTKEDESYQYAVRVEVSTKANSNQGGQQQSDQMAAEIYRIFDVPTSEYPDITDKGYRIYIIEFAETASFVEEVRGGTYFRKVITILVTAKFVGFDGTDIPVQLTDYNYNNWTYTPTVFDLERYDSGTIIPLTNYPNLSSGWNFVDSAFTIGAGAQGTFTNDIYTLGSDDDPVALSSTLNYTRDTDNYALMATTEWSRIGSLRFGVIESNSQPVFTDDTATSTGIRELSNFQSSDDTIRFGTQNPIGETITFNGVEGQWMYIIIDKSQANLTGLIDSFNEDNLNFFENPVVVGEYKVYVQKRALSYTNTLTFTIE